MRDSIFLAALLGLGLVALRPAIAEPPTPAETSAPSDEPALEQLTQQVRRSVVVITTTGLDGKQQGMGAGFIISDSGLVATNYHVIGEGRDIRVRLADGRQAAVTEVHASDRVLDLAILKIDAGNLKPLELGDSALVKQGQSVAAFGNPQGLQHSVVSGVVSGVRELNGRTMLQLAMPIEPGNSGGPLVDRHGRVQGIVTMKSLVTPNLGFALAINQLKPMLEKPNPILMSRWRTIGALNPRDWQTVFGGNWRQRAGRILVDGSGESFGGRALCLWQHEVPSLPYEMSVSVKLDDESGAAGLAFCSDGEDRHYGFYPTGGQLRLTRFEGPDVQSWQILYSAPSKHYSPDEWNTLRVRLEDNKIECFVNDEHVVTMPAAGLTTGKAGLVKFRNTAAEFKGFQVASQVPRATVPAAEAEQLLAQLSEIAPGGELSDAAIRLLAEDAQRSAVVLREQAARLTKQAAQLRQLAQAAHEQRTIADLVAAIEKKEEEIDLFRAGLYIARLDNEDVDVDAYCRDLEQMAAELKQSLPADADDATKLARLKAYLFEENGFHGSRRDYDNRANSYLNEVLDDREGLPITLSIVYMELARRIGLNVVGIGLPGHFVAAYVPSEGDQQLIDVFDGASEVSRELAEKRIQAAVDEPAPEDIERFLEPSTKRAIILRMLQNLLSTSLNDPPALHRYLNAMLAVQPDHGPYHFMRAMVRYQLDQRERAREDVEWLLEHEPPGVNTAQVRALQAELDRE
jgi:serine protease Do